MKLERKTSCQLNQVEDTWEFEQLDNPEKLKNAIVAVIEDHDEEVLIETDGLWILNVHWNDNTDSVWVAMFGYYGGMEVQTEDGEPIAGPVNMEAENAD